MAKRRGIFCLEGDWWGDYKKPTTVRPLLELLANSDVTQVPFIHKDVAVSEEFDYYLKKWMQKRHATHPILYFGFHGSKGHVHLEASKRSEAIDIDWLEDRLAGGAAGRMIHFGSCSTVAIDERRIKRFMRVTGLKAVSGYREKVPWVDSAAFELVLLDRLTNLDRGFTRASLQAMHRDVKQVAGDLARDLGFRMVVN